MSVTLAAMELTDPVLASGTKNGYTLTHYRVSANSNGIGL
jgi:hypothetical protein